MITDRQARRLMSMIGKGVPLSAAAAKAAMGQPTARKWRRLSKRPSEVKVEHTWRTRPDPFAEVWAEVQALLERDAGLEAKTVLWEWQRRSPGRFQAGQLRTPQRRFRDWRSRYSFRKCTARASGARRTSPTGGRSG
jgi:hypothetical protein